MRAFDRTRQLQPCIRQLRRHFKRLEQIRIRSALRPAATNADRAGLRRLQWSDHPDVRTEHASPTQALDRRGFQMTDANPALNAEEFASLIEVGKGETQQEIPQLHWERLVGLGYAVRRLGELGLTASGLRRLALGE
jgi:hypothetical protein